MSEARDTAGLLTTPGTKRSPSYTLTYTETDDHQFSTEEPSPKLYRAGVSTVRTPAESVPVSARVRCRDAVTGRTPTLSG